MGKGARPLSVERHIVRTGSYFDSVVLMQLQRRLAELDGVEEAGVVMATRANLELLSRAGLQTERIEARPDDLLVLVRGTTEAAARSALDRFDELAGERTAAAATDYRPKSVATALKERPEANWVLVSVPGEYAAAVARQAIDAGRHVFLYSDNVSLEDEVALKRHAERRRRLVLGPDCGTAMIGGAGLGFANRVRRGDVGIVAASGTGLQTIASRLHREGRGVSHGIGTGGRDLASDVGGRTALAALAALAADEETRVVVLVSKPPHPEVAARLLSAAARVGKPVVVHFQGRGLAGRRLGPLHFAVDLEHAAALAAELAEKPPPPFEPTGDGLLRGLFSGGTLAGEAVVRLEPLLPELVSNLSKESSIVDLSTFAGHAVLDLGADQFTVGRPHPMIDPQVVAEHLSHAAADKRVATIVVDVVLGDGAHPDPASILAPAIERARRKAREDLAVLALVVGTEEDRQEIGAQCDRLEEAGAEVFDSLSPALERVVARSLPPRTEDEVRAIALEPPREVINVGIDLFRESLEAQEVPVLQVDWRPPAGGNEKLATIVARLRESA